MNFLGHLFLAGDEPLAVVGNFMADSVKGRDLSRFPEEVQKGIRQHRAIDHFTDTHPLFVTGRRRVRIHRYSGVIMDLFYDHLLASQWERWHPEPLDRFAQRMYTLLHSHHALLPERTRLMLPHMVQGDWLGSYATIGGIGRALAGLSQRVKGGEAMIGAERILAGNLRTYLREFEEFLPQIKAHLTATR